MNKKYFLKKRTIIFELEKTDKSEAVILAICNWEALALEKEGVVYY